MRVVVTTKDIEKGRRSIADRCPVALALKRATHHCWLVYCGSLFDETTRHGVQIPESVADWVERYDDGLQMRPFAFELVA